MFNDSFYPTPISVIDQMLEPLAKDIDGRFYLGYNHILEPSAGKGNILDRMVERYHVRKANIACIELEDELRSILIGKDYKVIDMDFLKYSDPYYFDLIVMNPPFAEGAKHLLKAWDILDAGDIVCLLNAETILNPYSVERRTLLSLIEDYGRYEEIGAVFEDSERRTSVQCVIVWLHKRDENTDIPFDEEGFTFDAPVSEKDFSAPNPLATGDIIQSVVHQYQQAVMLLTKMHQIDQEYYFYTKDVIGIENRANPKEDPTPEDMDKSRKQRDIQAQQKSKQTLNEKLDALKSEFWRYVFHKTKIGYITTSNFQKKFEKMSSETQRIAFTYENVMRILEMFLFSRDDIIKACINDTFDRATEYHAKNKVEDKRWKHNQSWRIAPKIIMPSSVNHSDGYWSMNYYQSEFLRDIDKVLCFLSGDNIQKIKRVYDVMDQRCVALNQSRYSRDGQLPIRYDDFFYSTFFEIRFFKKGTVHLRFLDEDLLTRFNYAAAAGKNWLHSDY